MSVYPHTTTRDRQHFSIKQVFLPQGFAQLQAEVGILNNLKEVEVQDAVRCLCHTFVFVFSKTWSHAVLVGLEFSMEPRVTPFSKRWDYKHGTPFQA